MRILVACGSRAEIIKLGPVCQALQRINGVKFDVFWTGQHVELTTGLLPLFDIYVAHSGSSISPEAGLAGKFARITQQIERELRARSYDWIIVQGDSITAAAAATAGFLDNVSVAHIEAGMRVKNLHSCEQSDFYRRVISQAATLHFAPDNICRDVLLSENIPEDKILVVGNTVVDAALHVSKKMTKSNLPLKAALTKLPLDKKLIIAILHRRENIGHPLQEILRALRSLGEDGDKVIALQTQFDPALHVEIVEMLDGAQNIHLLPPLQYPDFIHLLNRAWAVVSDCIGAWEEVPALGLPLLIAREKTDRPEIIEAGFGRLVGSDYEAIVEGIRTLTTGDAPQIVQSKNPLGCGNAGEHIVRQILARAEQRCSEQKHLVAAE